MPVNRDLRSAFDLLDKGKKGYLLKPEAITWVRMRGCCASDADIERLLLNRVKTTFDGEQKFSFSHLTKIDEIYSAAVAAGQPLGPDRSALVSALSIASRSPKGDDQVSLIDLRQTLLSYSDIAITGAELDAFTKSLKIPRNTDLISSESLADRIIQTIKQ